MIDNISWLAIYPEIVLLVMACVIALVDLGVRSSRRTGTYVLTMLTLAVVAALQAMYASSGNTFYGWNNMVVSDAMGNWLKCFATVSLMVTLVYGRPYAGDRDMLRGGELFTLTMLALLGICVLISANNFILIYLGLELLALSCYALVALRRDHATATEAAMKYFVLGAMASGFLLYGLSMVYGATGSLDIGQVFKAINGGQIRHQVLVFGVVFIVAGLAFKFGAVPFHMWIPDVYQGAPTVVTLILSSAPKFAAFGMTIRLLVDGLLPLAIDWQQMLAVLAIGSLLVGNVAGVLQTNLKRMLAYSTISHMGFLFLGLLSGVVNGQVDANAAETAYSSAMFYIVTYVLTVLPTFGVIAAGARRLRERGDRRPGRPEPAQPAVCRRHGRVHVLAGRHSAAGGLLRQAVGAAGTDHDQRDGLHVALAVFAVVMSLIGAFYYLRVVKVMYFDAPLTAGAVSAPFDARVVLSLNGALVLILGVLPGGLMALCADAIVRALAT